jgi:hypothetical protein
LAPLCSPPDRGVVLLFEEMNAFYGYKNLFQLKKEIRPPADIRINQSHPSSALKARNSSRRHARHALRVPVKSLKLHVQPLYNRRCFHFSLLGNFTSLFPTANTSEIFARFQIFNHCRVGRKVLYGFGNKC